MGAFVSETEKDLSVKALYELLSVDLNLGKLWWNPRPLKYFAGGAQSDTHRKGRWDSQFAGREAFTATTTGGYLVGVIFGKHYLKHRVLVAMRDGEWPAAFVDHIDGNRINNSIYNLRSASKLENGANCSMHKSNTSGVNGVWFSSRRSAWVAEIKVAGRKIHLGQFADIERAAKARREANFRYGFTDRHGT